MLSAYFSFENRVFIVRYISFDTLMEMDFITRRIYRKTYFQPDVLHSIRLTQVRLT